MGPLSAEASGHSWYSMGKIDQIHTVYASVWDNAGNLYIGGNFTQIDDVVVNGVAMWRNGSWSALGSGVGYDIDGKFQSGRVSALAFSGGALYVAGEFNVAGGVKAAQVAKWVDGSWSALGGGINHYGSQVSALAAAGDDLYVGGSFLIAGGTTVDSGGVTAHSIAKWDGSKWSALGSGMEGSYSNHVYALALSDEGILYAGGAFDKAGGKTVNGIARWWNNTWFDLNSGTSNTWGAGRVTSLAIMNGELYAGGSFTMAGTVAANNIARWSKIFGWSALDSGISGGIGGVTALAVAGDTLYAGGNFDTAGGIPAGRIAKWSKNDWSAIGLGIGSTDWTGSTSQKVLTLATSVTQVFAGGSFVTAGGKPASSIAGASHFETPIPAAVLSKLIVKGKSLSPVFHMNTFHYSVKVPAFTKFVRIQPTAKRASSKIRLNGVATTSGTMSRPIALNKKKTTVVLVKVTASNDSEKTYRITFKK